MQPATAADTVNGQANNTHLSQTWTWNTNTGSNNNGNLQSVSTSHGGPNYPAFLTFSSRFGYDAVNRLTSASELISSSNNAPAWSRNFGYDQYGNMSLTANTGVPLYGTTPVSTSLYNPYNPSTNKLVSARYDAAGNQTEVGSYSLSYDAENRQTQAVDNVSEGQASYGYDGFGQRVTKSANGYISTVYVYDIFGQLAAEYNNFPGQASSCGTPCFLSVDQLGSTRLVTDSAANIISRHDYMPFGEEIPANTAGRKSEWGPFGDITNQKFTGQERDGETGFDFFQARYFYGAQGRFNSPDPGNAGADPSDPQTWNAYAYVRNNPMVLVDPSGYCTVGPDGVAHDDQPGDCGGGGTTVYGGPIDPITLFPVYYPNCQYDVSCYGGGPVQNSGSSGGGGGGGSASPPATTKPQPPKNGLLNKLKNAACSAIPNGRTIGVNGSLGLIAGPTGSVEQVVNYDAGSVNYFASGGMQAGWNGGAQSNVFGGVIYGNLGNSSQNYSGPFTTVSGSGALVGGYAQSGSGIKVFGGSAGVTLLSEVVPFTFGASRTVTSKPLQGGSVVSSGSPIDLLLYAARQVCH